MLKPPELQCVSFLKRIAGFRPYVLIGIAATGLPTPFELAAVKFLAAPLLPLRFVKLELVGL
jgi:hypothetical protein